MRIKAGDYICPLCVRQEGARRRAHGVVELIEEPPSTWSRHAPARRASATGGRPTRRGARPAARRCESTTPCPFQVLDGCGFARSRRRRGVQHVNRGEPARRRACRGPVDSPARRPSISTACDRRRRSAMMDDSQPNVAALSRRVRDLGWRDVPRFFQSLEDAGQPWPPFDHPLPLCAYPAAACIGSACRCCCCSRGGSIADSKRGLPGASVRIRLTLTAPRTLTPAILLVALRRADADARRERWCGSPSWPCSSIARRACNCRPTTRTETDLRNSPAAYELDGKAGDFCDPKAKKLRTTPRVQFLYRLLLEPGRSSGRRWPTSTSCGLSSSPTRAGLLRGGRGLDRGAAAAAGFDAAGASTARRPATRIDAAIALGRRRGEPVARWPASCSLSDGQDAGGTRTVSRSVGPRRRRRRRRSSPRRSVRRRASATSSIVSLWLRRRSAPAIRSR